MGTVVESCRIVSSATKDYSSRQSSKSGIEKLQGGKTDDGGSDLLFLSFFLFLTLQGSVSHL
jgi:hypothetical protein